MWFEFGFGELLSWLKNKNERDHDVDVMEWRRTRKQLFQIYSLFSDKKITETEYMPLDGDVVKNEGSMSPVSFFKAVMAAYPKKNGQATGRNNR